MKLTNYLRDMLSLGTKYSLSVVNGDSSPNGHHEDGHHECRKCGRVPKRWYSRCFCGGKFDYVAAVNEIRVGQKWINHHLPGWEKNQEISQEQWDHALFLLEFERKQSESRDFYGNSTAIHRALMPLENARSAQWSEDEQTERSVPLPHNPCYIPGTDEQDSAMFYRARNATVRALIWEKIRPDQQLALMEHVQTDDFGSLYRAPQDVRKWGSPYWLKVLNSTPEPDGSYRDYWLRVPPNMQTARQAIAWTFGLTEEQYTPVAES